MKPWIFDCRQISRLTSDAIDRELPLPRRIGMRIHLLMCSHCAQFARQLRLWRKVLRTVAEDPPIPHALDDAAKKRLHRMILDHLDPSAR